MVSNTMYNAGQGTILHLTNMDRPQTAMNRMVMLGPILCGPKDLGNTEAVSRITFPERIFILSVEWPGITNAKILQLMANLIPTLC